MKNRMIVVVMAVVMVVVLAVCASAMGKKPQKVESQILNSSPTPITNHPSPILAQSSTTNNLSPLDNMAVITEEYVARTIIEGKWGTNELEFGIELQELYDSVDIVPNSLAVDSKGNIYILDLINNRIKKYSKSGQFILNILVDSHRGINYEGAPSIELNGVQHESIRPIYSQGVNIAINSEDSLFYYVVHSEKGYCEILEFKDDQLTRKIPTPCGDSIRIDMEDSVWAGTNKVLESETVKKIKKEKGTQAKGFKVNSLGFMAKEEQQGKTNSVTFVLLNGKEKTIKKTGQITLPVMLPNKNVYIGASGDIDFGQGYFRAYHLEYDLNGNLRAVIREPRGQMFGGKEIKDAWYHIRTSEAGIQVIKWQRESAERK